MPRTTFSEIITDYAMVEIDDVRLHRELAVSPARFYRKMCLYMNNAIPRFNRPPVVRGWLKYTPARWDDYQFAAQENMAKNTVIATGKKGYDLASAILQAEDGFGGIEYVPVPVRYDKVTGEVTLLNDIEAGAQIDIDFYTDGVFNLELGGEMKRILGLCVQLVWENRFVNTFLLQQPKIKDRSFDLGSEANHMNAGTNRLRALTQILNSELNAFEQAIAFTNVVLKNNGMTAQKPNGYADMAFEVNEETMELQVFYPDNGAQPFYMNGEDGGDLYVKEGK
jgi:hypothetical protein